MRIYEILGAAVERVINAGVRALGKRVHLRNHPWLHCPAGSPGIVGAQMYSEIAGMENLEQRSSKTAGLLANFADLESGAFDSARIHPRIRDFYEKTAAYELEAWSEVGVLAWPLLWGLVRLVSRRMDQLVFPLSPLELSGGMSSEIIELVDKASGKRVYTGWRRKLLSNRSIIYAGLYSTAVPPNYGKPCVRVSFPVPRGNATVILRPEAGPDGSLWLIAHGRSFGDPGFYRVVKTGPERWAVRYIPQIDERFHVFVDGDDILRTEHKIRVLGIKVLTLHYKMCLARQPVSAAAAIPEVQHV